MNHKKYEQMILLSEELTADQREELNNHIATCDACRRLSIQWQKASRMLHKPLPLSSPTPGFSARFTQGIKKRKEAEQQRQLRRFISILIVSLLVASLSVALIYISTNPPQTIVRNLVSTSAQLLFLWESAKAILSTFLDFFPVVLLAPFLLTAGSAMLTLTLLWLVSMWKLTLQKETVL